MSKKLNFFPFYEEYLLSHKKRTTIRLDNRDLFIEGEKILITMGWNEESSTEISTGVIEAVYSKRINQIIEKDLEGESPDCRSIENIKLALSCVYRRVLRDNDSIWIIKFRYGEKDVDNHH